MSFYKYVILPLEQKYFPAIVEWYDSLLNDDIQNSYFIHITCPYFYIFYYSKMYGMLWKFFIHIHNLPALNDRASDFWLNTLK